MYLDSIIKLNRDVVGYCGSISTVLKKDSEWLVTKVNYSWDDAALTFLVQQSDTPTISITVREKDYSVVAS